MFIRLSPLLSIAMLRSRHASDYCAIPLILIYINTSSGIKLHFTARLFWQGVYDIGFTTWIFL
ncbi:hypothetical protein CAY66_17620 [Klebsiella variicola]|nr:hypothetical protein CAY66_17620 [Klebsiella variicola]MBZ7035111.1 hypothetical protein [Klebsiella variicola]HBY0414792.1 hypothetical protein [Klebsiella variicola]